MEKIDHVEFDFEYHKNGVNISHLFVDPNHRNQDYGSKVLTELEKRFEKEGLDYIVVNMKGGDVAKSFLRSNGFNIVEEQGEHVTGEKDIN